MKKGCWGEAPRQTTRTAPSWKEKGEEHKRTRIYPRLLILTYAYYNKAQKAVHTSRKEQLLSLAAAAAMKK